MFFLLCSVCSFFLRLYHIVLRPVRIIAKTDRCQKFLSHHYCQKYYVHTEEWFAPRLISLLASFCLDNVPMQQIHPFAVLNRKVNYDIISA